MLAQQGLGIVGPVEGLAARVVARPGMVPADDEMAGAVVLADDGVPDRLAGATHAHGQGQQGQGGGGVRVALHDRLVAPHPGVMVDVARLGHAHRGMDEQVGLDLAGGPQGQLDMSAVHGVAGLESDHPVPAQLGETRPQLRRAQPQRLVVVVGGGGQDLELAGHVHRPRPLEQVGGARVLLVGGAEDQLGLLVPIGTVELADMQHSQHHALRVAQGQAGADADLRRLLLGYVQGDGNGPQRAIGQAHALADAFVVLLAEEAAQRREATVGQELEVAESGAGAGPTRPSGETVPSAQRPGQA